MNEIEKASASIQGWASEKQVQNVLRYLVMDKIIEGFAYSGNNTLEDKRGIDFKLYFKTKARIRAEMPLQVKSSQYYLEKHLSRENQDIPAVNGQSENLKDDIIEIINNFKSALNNEQKYHYGRIDWSSIREEFEAGEKGYKIALKYKVDDTNLYKKAKQENWNRSKQTPSLNNYRKITLEKEDEIKIDYLKVEYSLHELADRHGVTYSQVRHLINRRKWSLEKNNWNRIGKSYSRKFSVELIKEMKELSLDKTLSSREIAEACGCHKNTIQMIRTGKLYKNINI